MSEVAFVTCEGKTVIEPSLTPFSFSQRLRKRSASMFPFEEDEAAACEGCQQHRKAAPRLHFRT